MKVARDALARDTASGMEDLDGFWAILGVDGFKVAAIRGIERTIDGGSWYRRTSSTIEARTSHHFWCERSYIERWFRALKDA